MAPVQIARGMGTGAPSAAARHLTAAEVAARSAAGRGSETAEAGRPVFSGLFRSDPTEVPPCRPRPVTASSPTTAPRQREQIVEMLTKAYWMEIETVMSYIANSVNPDGVRAQEIIESLREDIQEELGHAQQFADAHQGALRRRARLDGLQRRADLPAAARAPDRHRPRHQGRDRGRDRRDRALQRDHRGDRGASTRSPTTW